MPVTRLVPPRIDLSSLNGFVTFTELIMEKFSPVLGLIQKGDYVLGLLQKQLFPDPHPSGDASVSSFCSLGKGVPIPGALSRPFNTSPGLYQGIRSGFRVSSSERDQAPSLPRRQASHRIVDSSPPAISGAAPLALSGPGDCHQLGEVRPQAIQQVSISQNADIHHPRDGLTGRFSDYQIPRYSRQVPFSLVSSREDVATDLWPHGVPGTLCSLGSHMEVPYSVAAEVLLVISYRRSFDAGATDKSVWITFVGGC